MKKHYVAICLTALIQIMIMGLGLTLLKPSIALAGEPAVVEALPTRLSIPAIALDSPIVPVKPKFVIVEDKTYQTWEVADNDVGWHTLSAPLGQVGNTVLAGHSNLKARVFRHLHRINVGDEIIVFAGERAYHYIVTQKFEVREAGMPPEVRRQNGQWIAPTDDERLTLVTCIRPGATHRLIVVARPVQA